MTTVAPSTAAGTTGTISGTISTSEKTKPGLAGVSVTAVAPSARYRATTDAKGFFALTGVTADTYTIVFTLNGYETTTLTGVTVAQDQSVDVSTSINKALQQIGRTSARSRTSAYQPQQTVDQYNVGVDQINTVLGKSGGANEAGLLASIPGASYDSTGYPVLRGGRENEEGFQFEGIDYTDAFTNQFVNSLILNGASNFQVTPGAGDASIGNAGTGSINIIAKRGTHPSFGQLEGDVLGGGSFQHIFRGEYGQASPDGRFSNYASFYASRQGPRIGIAGTDAIAENRFFTARRYAAANDLVENFVYKFGRSNNQSLQFFYNNTEFDSKLGVTTENLFYKINDPAFLANAGGQLGLTKAQIQSVMPFTPGQMSLTDRLGARGARNYNQPNDTFKLQYSNNLDTSTFLTLKYYKVNSVDIQDFPFLNNGTASSDFVDLTGGLRTGFALDATKQLGSKHLIGLGAKYEFLHPTFTFPSATQSLYTFSGFGYTNEVADFLPNDAACPYGAGACGFLLGNNPTGTKYILPGTRLPYTSEGTATNRQDYSFYLTDTYSPSEKLRIQLGLRVDGATYRLPSCTIDWCLPTSTGTTASGAPDPTKDRFDYDQATRTPRVFEPRLGVSYQLSRRDAVRFTYGRSVTLPPLSFVDAAGERFRYAAYANVPSHDPSTGAPARFCGTTGDRACTSYADQLYWENAATFAGQIPIVPLLPTTFNNFEFSYTHAFPHNVAVKLTPFYRKAYNETALTAQPIVVNGVTALDPSTGAPQLGPTHATNLGNNQITGVEFYLTKEAAYGLSGSLGLTYQNEFSNALPTTAGENFFPSVPPEVLALHNTYRVGFLSPFNGTLALNYRSRSGWRVNPTIFYNHGYPIGSGLLTPATVNGKPYNVPNTNVSINGQLGGSVAAPQYVDPRSPGSVFNPNIAASRGTPDTSSPGGTLSVAQFYPVQMTFEFTPPRSPKNTFGVVIANLFNNNTAQPPALNPRYQPIATGIAGPYSGYSANAGRFNPGYINYNKIGGNQAYLMQDQVLSPRSFNFYFQRSL